MTLHKHQRVGDQNLLRPHTSLIQYPNILDCQDDARSPDNLTCPSGILCTHIDETPS